MSSSFESRFHSDVVQCKRVKKPCYLHIYIRVYRKCLYKWEDGPPCTLGTPLLRDPAPSLSKVSSPNQSGEKPRADGGWRGAPPVPPATAASSDPLHGWEQGRGEKLLSRTCRNTKTSWERNLAHVQPAQGPGGGGGWDQARGGRAQHVQIQHLIPWKSCSGKQLWKGQLLQLQSELTPG